MIQYRSLECSKICKLVLEEEIPDTELYDSPAKSVSNFEVSERKVATSAHLHEKPQPRSDGKDLLTYLTTSCLQ